MCPITRYNHDKNHSVMINRACHFGPFIENAGVPFGSICVSSCCNSYICYYMRIYMHNIRIGSNITGEYIDCGRFPTGLLCGFWSDLVDFDEFMMGP